MKSSRTTFVVAAIGLHGAVSRRHNAVKATVLDAIDLMSRGLRSVTITDSTGRVYRSSEFHRLLDKDQKG
jgi:hypothetical protein